MTKNRNPIGQWFITFPQSNIKKEDFLKKIWTDKQLLEYAVCQESHEDGKPHLHANIKLRYKITYSNMLGKIKKTYPNDYKRIDIRSTREKVSNAIEGYLTKEDNKENLYMKVVESKKKNENPEHLVMAKIHMINQDKGDKEKAAQCERMLANDEVVKERVQFYKKQDDISHDNSIIRALCNDDNMITREVRGRLYRMIRRKSNNVM